MDVGEMNAWKKRLRNRGAPRIEVSQAFKDTSKIISQQILSPTKQARINQSPKSSVRSKDKPRRGKIKKLKQKSLSLRTNDEASSSEDELDEVIDQLESKIRRFAVSNEIIPESQPLPNLKRTSDIETLALASVNPPTDASPPRANKRPRIKLINTSPPKPAPSTDSSAMVLDAIATDLDSDAPLAQIEPDETVLEVDVLSSETQFLLTDAPLRNAIQEDGLALVPENGHSHPCNALTTYPLDVDNLVIFTNSNANSNNNSRPHSVTATNNHYSSNNNHTASNNNHQPVVHDLTSDAATDDMLGLFNNMRAQTRSRARSKPSPVEKGKDGLSRPHVRSKGATSFRDTSAMILQSHVEEEEILAEVRERTGKSSTRERAKSSARAPPSPRERRKSGTFWKASGRDSSEEEEDSVREYLEKKKSSRKAEYKRSNSLSKNNSYNHNNSSRKSTASNNNNHHAVYVNKPASKNGIRHHRTTVEGAASENGRLRQSKLITEAVELAKNSTYSYERKITQYVPTPTPPIFEKRYNKAEREAYWHKDMVENNTLAKEENWPYDSELPSFLFDSATKFKFNRQSFLNCDRLKQPPADQTAFTLEDQYGERLDVLKRKLALGGPKSRHYSDSDYVFFGAGINRYSSLRSHIYCYVYKAINEKMLERLTTVYQHFFANFQPVIIPNGVRVEGGSGGHTRALFQKELIMRGTVTLGNVLKLPQKLTAEEQELVTDRLFDAICSQLRFLLDYGFIVKGGTIREEELKPDNFLIRRTAQNEFEVIYIDIKHLVYVGFDS